MKTLSNTALSMLDLVAVLVGHSAGGTQMIRVGSGGTMLPNHACPAQAQHRKRR